jgi:hypothetical protein
MGADLRQASAFSVGFLGRRSSRQRRPFFQGLSIVRPRLGGRGARAIARAERRSDFDRRPPVACVLAQGRVHQACIGSERGARVSRSRCHWRNRVRFPRVKWHGVINQPEPKRAFHHESHRPSPALCSVEPNARMLRAYRKLSSTWKDFGHAKLTLREARPIRFRNTRQLGLI